MTGCSRREGTVGRHCCGGQFRETYALVLFESQTEPRSLMERNLRKKAVLYVERYLFRAGEEAQLFPGSYYPSKIMTFLFQSFIPDKCNPASYASGEKSLRKSQ